MVFYFDNELDWQVAYETLNLPRVASARVGGKTLEQKGESRILPGQVLLDLFNRDFEAGSAGGRSDGPKRKELKNDNRV